MKICILTRSLNTYTGSGEFVFNFIKETKLLMPEIVFFTMTNEDILELNFFSLIKNWSRIRCQIQRADIIHAFDAYPYGVIAVLANFFINRPLIITAIGTGSLQLFDYHSWKAKLFRLAYTRASRITAISRYVANEIERHVKNIKVEVINPGIDYDYWSAVRAAPIDIRLKGLQPYILSVGELKRRKGYDVMLPIMSDVFKVNSNAKYVIVGNIGRNLEYRDKLYRQIKELGLEDKVVILSDLSRDDLRSVFQHAYLYFTLPQNVSGDIEGFGISILQAAAAGLPAIVGKGSGAEDAVTHDLSGFLISSDQPSKIVEKINELLTEEILREKLLEGAKEFAIKMRWQNQVKPYVRIYQELNK